MAQVVSVCISEIKGTKKHPVAEISLRPHHGIVGDAHAGDWHRQVSLLANESVDRMRKEGLTLAAGDASDRDRAARGRGAARGHADRQGVPQ